MRRRIPRFDLIEITMIVVLAVVATAVATSRYFAFDQDDWLRAKYGRHRWSHGPEEWIARDFFNDRRDGVFVDVGSADARSGSNTYYLESSLGWSGVAVDAMSEYAPGYTKYRPRTQFFSLFVSDHSDADTRFFVGAKRPESSSNSEEFTKFYAGSNVTTRTVRTITLNDLLTKANVSHVDFVSLDIEMAEPLALQGFDIERFRPAIVCVEAHPPIRQQLIEYFLQHGYTVVGKYLWVDPANLWFMPRQ